MELLAINAVANTFFEIHSSNFSLHTAIHLQIEATSVLGHWFWIIYLHLFAVFFNVKAFCRSNFIASCKQLWHCKIDW